MSAAVPSAAGKCLGDETIAAMLEGVLPDASAQTARRHIAGCEQCRQLVSAAVDVDTAATAETMRDLVRHATDVVPGVVIAGRYRIERLLGEGGMGRVFVARQLGLERAVAVKVLRSELAHVAHALKRFQREARLLASLANPHVIRVFDLGELGDRTPYLVMELLDGEDLGAILARGPVHVDQAIAWMVEACAALAEAHSLGIVHRDIKPSNLFITRQGRLVVLDFGLAKLAQPTPVASLSMSVTGTGMVLGSPHYMAPEQIVGARDVTPRADIWALGATLHHLLTGRPPFPETSIEAVFAAVLSGRGPTVEGLRPDLAYVVQRAMAPNPDHRFATAGELAAALRVPWRGSHPPGPTGIPTGVPTVPELTRLPPRRSRTGLWIGVTLALTAIVVATVVGVNLSKRAPVVSPVQPAPASLAGESRPQPPAPTPAPTPPTPITPAPSAPVIDEDYLLGLYISCFNGFDERVRWIWGRYTAWADPKGGPDKSRAESISHLDFYETKKCREELAAARALPALTSAADAYSVALETLVTVVRDADTYFEQGTFKDDRWVKGMALHGQLQRAFGAYDVAEAALRTAWMDCHHERERARLVELERSGGRASELFATEQVLIAAETVMETPFKRSAAIALEEACTELATFFGPALSAGTDTDRYMFKTEAFELLAEAKEAARAVAANNPLPPRGKGSREALVTAYKGLIERSNWTTWTTARDQYASARPLLRATERLTPAPDYTPPAAPAKPSAAPGLGSYDAAGVRARLIAMGWEVKDVTTETFPGCVHTRVQATRPGYAGDVLVLDCESTSYTDHEATRLTSFANSRVVHDGKRILMFSASSNGGLTAQADSAQLATAFLGQ